MKGVFITVDTTKSLRTATALGLALTVAISNAAGVPSAYAYTVKSDVESIRCEIGPYMDISSTSGISKDDFVYAMEHCKYDANGVLADNAEFIWTECQEYELNEFAICGILAGESGWATSKLATSRHNVMSIRGSKGYKYFDSYEECIGYSIELIATRYIDPEGTYYTGGVLMDIGYTYAGEDYGEDWAKLVSNCAYMCTEGL